MARGTFRIGTGAGFSADRLDAAIELAKHGRLDAMVLECLGERTVAFAHRDRMANPARGYNALLDKRMEALLPLCAAAGTVIVTNMGAANPRAAAERTVAIARGLGLKGLKVACIEGDDVSGTIALDSPFMDEAGCLADIDLPIVGVNAYLGADVILAALRREVDVVIGGRLADPSMFLAPIMHRFGWEPTDFPLLGAGTLIGHLMECGMQVTGGYFADSGRKEVPDLVHCGYPIGEVDGDGTAIMTKLENSGGLVSEATVKEQLLYEVHNPAAYLTPDVSADFSKVRIESVARNRVRVSGASGSERPSQLKVTVGFDGGYLGEAGVSYAGPSADERGRLAAEIVTARLREVHGIRTPLRTDLIGVRSLFSTAGRPPSPSEDVRLHMALRSVSREEVEIMLWEVEALLCCGPAGGGGFRGVITPSVITKSVLIDRQLVKPGIEVMIA